MFMSSVGHICPQGEGLFGDLLQSPGPACVRILVDAEVAEIEPCMANQTPMMPKITQEKTSEQAKTSWKAELGLSKNCNLIPLPSRRWLLKPFTRLHRGVTIHRANRAPYYPRSYTANPKQQPDKTQLKVRCNLFALILSGACMGAGSIGLHEL